MIGTDFALAKASLKGAKVRSIMTMIAVIIGVLSFVLITTFIDGFEQTLKSEIDEFGGNLVAVNPCKAVERDEERNIIAYDPVKNFTCAFGLSEADLQDLRSLDGVQAAAPVMIVEATASRNDVDIAGTIILATDYGYPEAFNQAVDFGDFFDEDVDDSNFVVIGKGIADELFNGIGLGAQIAIRGEKYTVIGVMQEYSLSFSGGFDFNRSIFVPLEAGKKLNNGIITFGEIDIQLGPEVDAEEYVIEAEKVLLENYGNEEVFTVLTQEESLDLFGEILGYMKIVSQVISYIMLFVGGTVIALIMLVTVKERTREIGIRKSIGATNNNILTQFVIEAILISWIGSIIGIVLAYLIGFYLASVSDITPVYTMSTIISVVVIATVIGAVSGLIPAFMAARKDPVEALRDD